MPTRGDVMVPRRGTGRARAAHREVVGMQAYPLERPANRNSLPGRGWVSRALVHTPRRRPCGYAPACLAVLLVLVPLCGCTPLTEYVHNGFKVGPNYGRPPAPAAKNWIDAADGRVRKE